METLFHANSPFTVTGENEVGVDLVLTQPFLLYHVNHVILTTVTYFLSKISIRGETFVSKQGQLKPHVHWKARILNLQLQIGLLFISFCKHNYT